MADSSSISSQFRLSFLPPLMVYLAAGVSGLTGIVGTFFVKDYLGLSAEFLAMLGFWAGLVWAVKMPLGHLVDLLWRYKALFVFAGAAVIATSLLIMLGLISRNQAMLDLMSIDAWFVLSVMLTPIGYVLQDVVADAMTVEAVPRVDDHGAPYNERQMRLMHTTMQTLGRVAIIGGGIAVALINLIQFSAVDEMQEADKVATYIDIYQLALLIPLVSVMGVVLAFFMRSARVKRMLASGVAADDVVDLMQTQQQRPQINWWILGGSALFVLFSMFMGLGDFAFGQEAVFLGSFTIIVFLMSRLVRELDEHSRHVLVGTAVIIFVFRALPGPGAGASWFVIDELGFDQQFLSLLSVIASSLTLLGMFVFRRFMAEHSIATVIVFLTIAGTVMSLPNIGLFYGIQEWTAPLTGGVVDARFIAIIDTAVESPLGQIAMIPMLAWIARSAPQNLKATFFAVMASFTNLALSASQLGTRYLNQIFSVSREVKDPVTETISVSADYSELGWLLITVTLIGLLLPLLAVWLVRASRLRSE
jgi:hypothetical protein